MWEQKAHNNLPKRHSRLQPPTSQGSVAIWGNNTPTIFIKHLLFIKGFMCTASFILHNKFI